MKCLAVQPRLVPLLSFVFTCAVWTCGSLCAQPAASDAPPPARAESGDVIRESDLKWRLVDEDGILRPVPAFTLELFQELLELQSRIKAQKGALPKTVFNGSIELDGRVDAEKHFARLKVTFRIRLTSRPGSEEQAWTAIPLRLDNLFVDVAAIEHDEQGELYIARDEASYVCLLLAAPDSAHTIRVPIKVPVLRDGTRDALSLMLPNMATTMRLTVDEAKIEAISPSGRNNVSSETQGSATVITVDGGGGELDLAWQQPAQVSPRALEATCATTVHVHGNHLWSEAQLKVRSRSAPIDSFIVQLPDGMEVTSRSDADFHIERLPSGDDKGPQRVLVKQLGEPTRGLIEVHLEAELPPATTAEKQRRTVQLEGFSVQDSVREWGSVDVTLDGNWLPIWVTGQFVQRVAVPEDPLRQQPVVARFLYDRQPYSLGLELLPKQARVSLETTCVVDVAAGNAQLDARIVCSTNGAKRDSLSFKMPGWTIDAVTTQESLAVPFSVDEQDTLTLPLAADATDFEFHIRAQRAIDPDAVEVSFDLPRPADSALLPDATLIVLASDDVELTPEFGSMKWLAQETRTPAMELPKRFASPLMFREELSTESDEAARFVARRRIRPRETTVAVNSEAILDGDMVRVRQSFLATVAYVPLTELTIAVPPSVAASGTLRITSGEQKLPYRDVTSAEPAPETATADLVDSVRSPITETIVSLPTAVTGDFQLEIAFAIPSKGITSTNGLQIPLVQPAGEEANESVTNTLTIRSDEDTAITLADERWIMQSDAALPPIGSRELRVRSTGVAGAALVRISVVERRTNGSTSIPRVWIQSWLTPTDRHDRVCFQLLSDQPLVHVQLPSLAQTKELRVLVDGKPLEFVDHGDNSLTVTLADEQVGRVVGFEMLYFSEVVRGSRFGVAVPSIIDADRAERVYWQIALPRNEHLAWIPATLTSELVWQRDQWYWGRRGRLEQPSLEELVGAAKLEAVSPDTNRYLFSSTGSVDSVGFVKVSRRMLMFVSSGLALLVVLPFIYIPALRQSAVFFVVGVLLFGVAVTYPEHSAVLGQTGAIGLGLAVVAGVLHRLVGRSPAMPAIRRGSVSMTPDSQANGASVRVNDGSSRATTATAPAHLQVARVEGEP